MARKDRAVGFLAGRLPASRAADSADGGLNVLGASARRLLKEKPPRCETQPLTWRVVRGLTGRG